MHIWPVQDAKAYFSELLRTRLTQCAQIISLDGKETAVLVFIAEQQRLQNSQQSSLKSLLSPPPTELDISERGSQQRRTNKSCPYFFHEHVT